jgi:hypothetical protein
MLTVVRRTDIECDPSADVPQRTGLMSSGRELELSDGRVVRHSFVGGTEQDRKDALDRWERDLLKG